MDPLKANKPFWRQLGVKVFAQGFCSGGIVSQLWPSPELLEAMGAARRRRAHGEMTFLEQVMWKLERLEALIVYQNMGFSAGCYQSMGFNLSSTETGAVSCVDPILIAEGLVEDSGCLHTDSKLDGADGHAHQKEQVEEPPQVPHEGAEPSPEEPSPHAQHQEAEGCEDEPEFSAPQTKHIISHTLEQCCERMMYDIDIDGLLAQLADKVPILQSDVDDLIASKSEMRVVINSLCENVAKAKSLGELDRGQMAIVVEEVAESSMRETSRSNSVRKPGATKKPSGQATAPLRKDPGFGRGPSRTPKKKNR